MISIHASAKEATWCPPFFWPLVHFNPRLREGGDAFTACIPIFSQEYFNPRLREGGDPNNQTKKADGTISIHASAKEATQTTRQKKLTEQFQSTPPRRRRRTSVFRSMPLMVFQSTPPRRRRPQHIVIPQLSCTYLVSTTFLSTIFSFISQYVVLFFLF